MAVSLLWTDIVMARFTLLIQCLSALVILSITSVELHGQSLNIFDTRVLSFPTVSAQLYVRNAAGNVLNQLAASDIQVQENGVPCIVTGLRCFPQSKSVQLSAVLAIDVSASMANGQPLSGITIAKTAARSWIGTFPQNGSECAVVGFDYFPSIYRDFTADTSLLYSAVDALQPQRSAHCNDALLNNVSGAYALLRTARHKRIAILLTDGRNTIDEIAAIVQAQSVGVSVYCIGLNVSLPEGFKKLSNASSALWFERISTAKEMRDVWERILLSATDVTPCQVEWQSPASCATERSVVISLPSLSISDTARYSVPISILPAVALSTNELFFYNVPPHLSRTEKLTITALSDSVFVSAIRSSDSSFRIIKPDTPFVLHRNESREIQVKYTPEDSLVRICSFSIEGNLCTPAPFYALGGFSNKRRSESAQLRILQPNGGETFLLFDTASINWKGVMPSDTLRLEYSINSGASWNTVKDTATGLYYAWKVPFALSNRCLLRAVHFASLQNSNDNRTVLPESGTVAAEDAVFSTDGSRAACIDSNGAVRIYDCLSQEQITPTINLPGGTRRGGVVWNPSRDVVAAVSGNTALLIDAKTYTVIEQATLSLGTTLYGCDFSSDGSFLLAAGCENGAHRVYAFPLAPYSFSSNILSFNTGHADTIRDIRSDNFLQQNTFGVYTASEDKSVRLFTVGYTEQGGQLSLTTCDTTAVFGGLADEAYSVDISPDGGQIAIGLRNGTLRIHKNTVQKIDVVPVVADNINKVAWSPNGRYVAVAYNSGTVAVWDLVAKALYDTEKRFISTPALSICWDKFSTRIMVSYSSKVVIWKAFESFVQSDISDSLWEITAPQTTLPPKVDVGKVRIGNAIDVSLKDVVCVSSPLRRSVRLDSVLFLNDATGSFSLLSDNPSQLYPPVCTSAEIQFRPQKSGILTATLRFVVNGRFAETVVSGEGVEGDLRTAQGVIDFGKVAVGSPKDIDIAAVITNAIADTLFIQRSSIAGPDTTQFSLSGDTVIALAKNDSSSLKVRFDPIELGRFSSQVAVNFQRKGSNPGTVSSPLLLQVYGEGICGVNPKLPPAILRFGDSLYSVKSGEIFTTPLLFAPPKNKKRSALPHEFIGRISFNATTLYPLDVPGTPEYQGGICTIKLNGVRSDTTDTLYTLKFLSLLGDTDTTWIRLDSLEWTDACMLHPTVLNPENIQTAVCAAGGNKRLLVRAPLTRILLQPNPVGDDNSLLTISLREKGSCTLRLHDLMGRCVATIVEGNFERGNHAVAFNPAELPHGMYIFVLQTPGETTSLPFTKW